jgi:hypothetical protein
VWFTTYLAITVNYFGVLPSISESFYRWQERDYSSAFVWFAAGICVLMFLQSAQPYKEWTKLILAGSGFFLMCVSIAANYKQKKVGIIHNIVTGLSMAGGFAANIVEFGWWAAIPIALFAGSLFFIIKYVKEDKTWWWECAGFGCIMMLFLI